jgi:hypothetical protein
MSRCELPERSLGRSFTVAYSLVLSLSALSHLRCEDGQIVPKLRWARSIARNAGPRVSVQVSTAIGANSFHEKAGECQAFSFIFSFFFFISSFSKLFKLSRAASVATLPSALFVERLSLGASWVYSIQ